MISIIIPTRDRSALLSEALRSIEAQNLPFTEYEILVVDNGSCDDTAAVIHEWSIRLGNLRYFYSEEPGLHVGRHRGMEESFGDVLVFIDDDIEAFPGWLAAIAATFEDSDVAMVGGNNLPMFVAPPPAWLLSMWEFRPSRGVRSLPSLSIQDRPAGCYEISPYEIWGCNFSIRKSVLLAAGGFHPDGMPKERIQYRGDGETHVSRYVAENGLRVLFNSDASVYHKVVPERMTFQYFRWRGFCQGVSDSYTRLRGVSTERISLWARASRLEDKCHKGLVTLRRALYYGKDARRAMREYRNGYQEGFAFHQEKYREDKMVQEWVHRESYF